MLQEQCLWDITAPLIDTYSQMNSDTQATVCIIGGGYTGLSAAIHLAEKGVKVVLLESKAVGSGGSGKSVGLVNAGTWARPDDLNVALGEEAGERLTEALGQAPSLVFDLIERYNIDAQATRAGNIHMAHNAMGELDVDIRYEQLSRRGADVEILTGSKCHEYCGSTSINKALLDRRAGTLNPLAYTRGLAKVATDLGVTIYEHSAVESLQKVEGYWYARTAKARVRSERVIIATNAYTEGEWTEIAKTFYLVYYYQIASEPLSGEVADRILPYGTGAWDTRLALSSFRRDDDGRLLLGTVGGTQLKPKSFYQSWANTVQKSYYPDLPAFKWQYEWCGSFGFTQDHIFRVMEPDEGLLTATAYNGRGITTGTMMGKCFAEYIMTGNRNAIPIPFKTLEESKVSFGGLKSGFTELGLTLYHAGQFLKIIR
ncbi:FAD-binding oxidoreductase [Psychrobacter sp. F1192]|uniref:FAD-binding oxidoreductase n=1 Tax=Psychrobacter coccoides TaxID=2818440 RepID=A0ABS3NQ88_9GAMM|nr:FAD-binding oxidoreductase [Psychrobacter coccoides]MBO1531579.1 FAD-binding oxidoreductase [Psychrobacter coccoides]